MIVAPAAAVAASAAALPIAPLPAPVAGATTGFEQVMVQGLQRLNGALVDADATLRAVAVGEAVPPHQAMLALEQARMELQLALQVRNRLLEGVQELMRMQL